jgi:hypothetical protein
MYLKDPHAHWEMVEGLENRYRESKNAASIPSLAPSRVTGFASRKVAEKIEKQTSYVPELTTWMFGRIKDIWPKRTCSLAETVTSQGFLLTLKFLLSAWVWR